MKTKIGIIAISFAVLAALPLHTVAQETGDGLSNVSGLIDVTGEVGDGQHESPKFDEYKDTPNGAVGNIELNYRDDEDRWVSLDTTHIALLDQRTNLSGGQYGKYKIDLQYDQTPHRFAHEAWTMYSGLGSGDMTLPDAMQADLQNNAPTPKDKADKLINVYEPTGHAYDAKIVRKKGSVAAEYSDLAPFIFKTEVSSEERTGERPILGSIGFSNFEELVQPIDYNTTNAKLSAEYLSKDVFASLGYYLSVFQNDHSSLTWDNPFRVTDDTAAGPAAARMSLAPDNIFHGPSAAVSFMNLPMKSRVSLNASWGFMSQNDDFLPYTSNTAILGTDPSGQSFAASDRSNLPAGSPEASVVTQLYSAVVTSKPVDLMDTKISYRAYDYNNNTDEITFPGDVAYDTSWAEGELTNKPASFLKQTAAAEAGYKVFDDTRAGLGYEWDGVHRTNREVEDQSDNTLSASIDHKFSDWAGVKTSYEKIFRRIGSYNFREPFGDEQDPPQMPLLRKYDEADRDTDQVHFLGTVTPVDNLSLAGSFIYGQSTFDESVFGLKDDRFYILSADVDYTFCRWASANAFYSYEQHNDRQTDRQWNPDGPGDPYVTDIGVQSNSNWDGDGEDVVHTAGAGTTMTLIPKTLFFDLSYAYSYAHGNVEFASPLGTAADDANPFVPSPWTMVDQTILQRVNPRIRWTVARNWELVAGYLWEKFNFNDFTGSGASLIPVKANGDFQGGILAGSWPWPDYEVNLGYVTVRYKF